MRRAMNTMAHALSVRCGWFAIGAAAGAVATLALAAPADAQERVAMATPLEVIDGDTVRDAAGERWRIANIDAPETWRAACDAERQAGETAAILLDLALAEASVIEAAPIARDRYGRRIARLYADGADVGEILIEAGVATGWGARREKAARCRDNARTLEAHRPPQTRAEQSPSE